MAKSTADGLFTPPTAELTSQEIDRIINAELRLLSEDIKAISDLSDLTDVLDKLEILFERARKAILEKVPKAKYDNLNPLQNEMVTKTLRELYKCCTTNGKELFEDEDHFCREIFYILSDDPTSKDIDRPDTVRQQIFGNEAAAAE